MVASVVVLSFGIKLFVLLLQFACWCTHDHGGPRDFLDDD